MNGLQTRLYAMYRDIAAVLETHGISYFIHYGTSIGALRHDGFVPWDDDIDMLVWEKDLGLINKVLSEELDPDTYYYHIPTADKHPHVIFRTDNFEEDLKNKTAPFIDIFVLVDYPDSKGRQVLTNAMLWVSIGTDIVLDRVSSLGIHKMLSRFSPWFERRAKNLSKEDTSLCTIYSTKFKKEVTLKKYFEKTVMHKFEDGEVPLPAGYDEILTAYYGDYMTPPPESDRRGAEGYPCSAYKDYIWNMQKNAKKR